MNRTQVAGVVSGKPLVERLEKNALVISFFIKTSDTWKNAITGLEEVYEQWHRVVVFESIVKMNADKINEDDHVFVDGNLKTRQIQDEQTGIIKEITEIIIHDKNNSLFIIKHQHEILKKNKKLINIYGSPMKPLEDYLLK